MGLSVVVGYVGGLAVLVVPNPLGCQALCLCGGFWQMVDWAWSQNE